MQIDVNLYVIRCCYFLLFYHVSNAKYIVYSNAILVFSFGVQRIHSKSYSKSLCFIRYFMSLVFLMFSYASCTFLKRISAFLTISSPSPATLSG